MFVSFALFLSLSPSVFHPKSVLFLMRNQIASHTILQTKEQKNWFQNESLVWKHVNNMYEGKEGPIEKPYSFWNMFEQKKLDFSSLPNVRFDSIVMTFARFVSSGAEHVSNHKSFCFFSLYLIELLAETSTVRDEVFIIIAATAATVVTLKAFTNRSHEITSSPHS